MTYRVSVSGTAAKDLKKLTGDQASRVLNALSAYEQTGAGDIKKLNGYNPGRWRLRVGDYRAILDV